MAMSGPIGLWQLADVCGIEPGIDARRSAAQHVSEILSSFQSKPGVLDPDQIRILGDHLSGGLLDRLALEMTQYDPDFLIPALVGQNELMSASMSFVERDLELPERDALLPFPSSLLIGLFSSTAMPQISLRFLLEFAAAQPPCGARPPDAMGVGGIWGLAEALLEVGVMRDAGSSGLDRICIEREVDLLRLRPKGDIDAAMKAQRDAWGSARVARLRGLTDDSLPRHVITLVDETLEELIGLDGPRFIEVMLRAKRLCDERGGSVCIAPEQRVISALAEGDVAPRAVQRTLDWLSLAPVSRFSPSAARYPWRFRRSQSYMRRPFVRREIQGREPVLIWGGNQIERSLLFLIEALTTGSLPSAGSNRLEIHNGTLGDWRGSAFERELTQLLSRRVPEMWIRCRVEKLGARELGPSAEPLPGDIDVLVGDSVRKCLTLIEAKANLPAFSTYDVVEELRRHSSGDAQERGDLDKHLERIVWAERHLEDLVRLSGFEFGDGWSVQGRWVTREPSVAAFLAQTPLKMTSIHELRENDVRAWLSPHAD
jgi:hypothetical protein